MDCAELSFLKQSLDSLNHDKTLIPLFDPVKTGSIESWVSIAKSGIPHDYASPMNYFVGYTITDLPEFSTMPKLGLVVAAYDGKNRLVLKYRVTPFTGENGKLEADIGIVNKDLRSGHVPKELERTVFPGTRYRGFGLLSQRRVYQMAIPLLRESDISAINCGSEYYHMFHYAMMFGAHFDPSRKFFGQDTEFVNYIESELDKADVGLSHGKKNLGYYRDRSWYVQDGKVKDPHDKSKSIRWKRPTSLVINLK